VAEVERGLATFVVLGGIVAWVAWLGIYTG
jgi:hypothetical protein